MTINIEKMFNYLYNLFEFWYTKKPLYVTITMKTMGGVLSK